MNLSPVEQHILEALLAGEALTDLEAFPRFGVASITPAIQRLRKRGVPIVGRPLNSQAFLSTPFWNSSLRPRYHVYRIPSAQLEGVKAQLPVPLSSALEHAALG